jgi:restriction system protein
MWEKKIFHPGLKAFRIMRAADQATVELRSQLQIELWDERWRKIQLAAAKRKKEEDAARVSFQKKELALQRTREAELQLDSLTRILRDGIEIDHVLDWEKLKDRSPFPEPKPEPREPLSDLPAPQPNSPEFSPRLTFIDRLIPSRRSHRVAEAERRYLNAKAAWSTKDQEIRETNAKQHTEYEARLKEWTARKTLRVVTLVGQHAEVDASRAAYEARQPDGLVECWSHVLFASEYPEGFPKSFALDYVAETQTVVIEYELPDIECLPRLKELKYIAVRDELREVKVSDAWLNRTYDDVLYQICLRTVHEVFQSDTVNAASSLLSG